MPRRRKEPSPVTSEEEDVDGDLSEISSSSGSETDSDSVPVNEVVYLPEDNSNLMPEEEEAGNQEKEQKNPLKPIIKVKTIDSLRETSEAELENDQSNSSSNPSSKSNYENKHKNGKVDNNGTQNSSKNKGCIKKAKYARQATPICDAIMREYSRRMRLMKQKGITDPSALGDKNIQELLKKAKENLESKKSETGDASHMTTDEESEDDNGDLPIIKQEIIDTKPEVINTFKFDTIKEEKDESVDSSTITSNNQEPKRGRPKAVRKRKRQVEWDEDDDTDEDPDFDPVEIRTETRNKRPTRSTRFRKDVPEKDYTSSVQEKDSSDVESQNSLSVPKEKAVNVTEQLKSLAEKIADVLTKEPSATITTEAEKLLQTTQELIKQQKEKIGNTTSSDGSTVKIKEEIPEDSPGKDEVHNSPFSTLIENSGFSLQIYNQLQMHEAALRKKISAVAANNDRVENISTAQIPTNSPQIKNVVSMKEKCTFIMDFFTSYQAVFDEYTLYCVIGELTNNLMIFIKELSQCIKRTNEAQSRKNLDQRQKEIELAKQSYLKTIMNSREKFLPLFKHVVNNIIKTRTIKALMHTLILFLAGSLYIKCQDIIKDKIHRLRRTLLFVTKAYQYHHQLVTEALTSPNDVFDKETMLVRHMLKYFQARKFFKIPSELLCYYPEFSVEEEQQYQAELSILDTAMLKQTNPLVNDDIVQNQGGNTQHGATNYQSRYSNVTAKFVETLENDPNENTKSIEEKLDNLLNSLSSSGSNSKTVNTQVNFDKGLPKSSRNLNVKVNMGNRIPSITTVKLSSFQDLTSDDQDDSPPDDKGTLLVQLLENDHIGLDSLFSSYLKENVKSEPEDIISTTIDVDAVKKEPEEIVSTEIEQTKPIIDHLVTTVCDDGFTEEYSFTKKEEKSFTA